MTTTDDHQVLPKIVRPTHYDITLTPDLKEFVFTGHETINLDINEDTKVIILNANEIEVKSAKLGKLNSESHDAVSIEHDEAKSTVKLTFPEEYPAGCKVKLYLEFTGILNDKMVGFYRSSYEENGEKRYMATTQFEATEARRAFPCWDEPAIKATFDITLIVPSDLVALSNMNVISEKSQGNDKREVKFATTPIMSTYLVAFIVGDLGYIEDSTSGVQNGGKPVLVRVYTLKGNEETGRFALRVSVDCLEYFAGVFGIPYPLPKCDMVAIPDFEAGAMENWGLITYRTAAVLFDPNASDARFKQRIAYTVCHELAHQWFGNLVTMEWWDHLWLNEGFATWVGYLAVDKIFPDWDIWTQFVSEAFQRGLQLDSLKSSHQIEVPVNDPSEISQIFDAISYYKGASVIRMLSNYLGENVFLAGVRRYLKKHEYGNASTNDLWNSLAEESGKDISEFISIWTRKVGYPVLTVTEPSPDTLNISQSRFLSTGVIDPEEDITIWWVPLNIDVGTGNYKDLKDVVLTQKEKSLNLPNRHEDFYQLNSRKTGVYRVNYIPERLAKLGQAVKKDMLETSDRVGLVADAGALAISGHGKTSGLLNLIKEFDKEEQYIVWMEINTRLSDLTSVWFEQPDYQSLLSFQCNLLSKLVHKLGWEYKSDDDYLTTMLRSLVIKIAGRAGDKDVVNEARRRFKLFISDNDENALHPNIRGVVYEIVLIHGGGEEEFEAILNIYKTAKIADQKVVALTALGHAQQEKLIQRALELSISDNVKSQDIIYPFTGLKENCKSRRALWSFIKQNWELIQNRYQHSLSLFGHIIKSLDSFSSFDDIRDIEDFFKDKNTKEIERPLQQSLENIRVRAAWLSRDKKDVEDWLRNNGF
ncbi:hypothetical protein Glove_692g11 [Diversispora epigaea]|uniref:Aminopeptidase n=1 Tax=Diversispora epigaea TaxID=1348612 RepID=A0A397G7Z8_9GLOM|nr:hypothetical protein Glove_692g11 [Diversispora epigaea]